jgi:hypothetical protein
MMKLLRSIFSFVLVLTSFGTAFAEEPVPVEDQQLIFAQLEVLEEAVNEGNEDSIRAVVVADRLELLAALVERVGTGYSNFDLHTENASMELQEDGQVQVDVRFSVSGLFWHEDNWPTSFTFENSGGEWLITETDLHEVLGLDFILDTFDDTFDGVWGEFPLLFTWVLICSGVFWLWMFVDCLRRDMKNKGLWIALMILLNFWGALIYLFVAWGSAKHAIKK